jgi:hypothetical protein
MTAVKLPLNRASRRQLRDDKMDDDTQEDSNSKDGNNPFDDLKKQFNDIFNSSVGKFNFMPMFIDDLKKQFNDKLKKYVHST